MKRKDFFKSIGLLACTPLLLKAEKEKKFSNDRLIENDIEVMVIDDYGKSLKIENKLLRHKGMESLLQEMRIVGYDNKVIGKTVNLKKILLKNYMYIFSCFILL